MPNTVDVTALGSTGFAINGPSQLAALGHSVSSAGDINGDGFDDVVVGAPYAGDWSKGSSYVVFGHQGGFSSIDVASLGASTGFAINGGPDDFSSSSVSGTGDINGDGFDDLIIGGSIGYYGTSSSNTYVIYGRASGFHTIDLGALAASDGFTIKDTTASDWGNGHTVSAAGDVNGDGVADMIIGSSRGKDYVIFGNKSGLGTIDLSNFNQSLGFEISSSVAGAFTYQVAAAGDLNGDGYDDLIVAGPSGSTPAAYVVYGHGGSFGSVDVSNLTSSQGFEVTAPNLLTEKTVSSAGDFNGDGYDDVLIGMPNHGASGSGADCAYIVFGKPTGQSIDLSNLSAAEGIILKGAAAGDLTGFSVAAAGDVNHDGYDDVVIGATSANDGAGEAYVIYGRPTGSAAIDLGALQPNDGFVVQGGGSDHVGFSVSGGGDVNGDGYADVLIGAPGNDTAAQDAGAGYVIFGGPSPLEHITGTDAGETITGTGASEYIDGLGGNDLIYGRGGNDLLHGGSGNDRLDGGAGVDKMYGGAGDDTYIIRDITDYAFENAGEGTDRAVSYVNLHLRANVENLVLAGTSNIYGYGNDLDNVVTGNAGINKLFGLGGSDTLDGKGGADLMTGGSGDDRYYVDSYGDRIVENAAEGSDSVFASANYKLAANIEKLTLTGSADIWGYGNDLDNALTGNGGANKLYGLGGSDTIKGGGGNDWIEGGAGKDMLYGGAGADSFVFRGGDFGGATAATADRILDFSQGEDVIRLNYADANTALGGDQAFHFIGTSAFDGTAGELRYQQISGATYISGDTNGDGAADFMIRLDGLHTLTTSDFVL